MKTRTFCSILILIVIMVVGGCIKNDKPQIGVLLHKYENSVWKIDGDEFVKKIESLGGEAHLRSANKSQTIQYDQALELINNGVDVLIIVPQNVNNAAAIVRKAKEKGVKVISYRRLIENADLDYFAGFDLPKCGQIQIEYVLNRHPEKANIMIFEGDYTDKNAHLIEKAHMKAIEKRLQDGTINLIYKTYIDDWSEINSAFEFRKAYHLSNERIDAIVSSNDNLATGAIIELEKFGETSVKTITGMDATLKACQRIVNGDLNMTIYKPVKVLVEKTATLAVKLAKGEEITGDFRNINNQRKDVKSLILEPIVVDKNNIDKEIIEAGVYSRDEVY